MALHLCGMRNHNPSLTIRKRSKKPRLMGILQNSLPLFLKTLNVNKNKEGLRNCHRPDDTEKYDYLNAMPYPRGGMLE